MLKINSKTVNYNGSSVSIKIYPGTYIISITKKGYYNYTKTIKITQDYSIRTYQKIRPNSTSYSTHSSHYTKSSSSSSNNFSNALIGGFVWAALLGGAALLAGENPDVVLLATGGSFALGFVVMIF
ncbi:MAG: PEGA domain-containing protein [Spirochaetales bacterium]|nr:PEGA domain-containing protein [Spirochaetales bacterium]